MKPTRVPAFFGLPLLLLALLGGCARTPLLRSADDGPLEGQILVDPENPSYLVYNRDRDGDGRLDPFFLIGPGDPEGFFYLGERQEDGTRRAGAQREIVDTMRRHGGNGLYFQVVRSHGGDGEPDHNPWRDPEDPASGLDPEVVAQWRGWLDRMQEAGITMFLFLYDDGAHPFDDGCTGTVSAEERAFVRELVDTLEDYPNLIWVVQEEFKFVGHAGVRRPCDAARVRKAGTLASLIKEFDDHDHPVGVHHNIGDPMAFPDHPDVDLYVQQADVRVGEGQGTLEALHAAGLPGRGFDPEHRYNYTMGEAYNWHHVLMDDLDRAMLRKSYYASALAGGYVLVLGMYGAEGPPTPEMLEDMRRMQTFFESSEFNRMAPHDALRYGSTRWVLADPEGGRYILYAYEDGDDLGVRGLRPGRYTLRWFDPVSGADIVQRDVEAAGDVSFQKPAGIGAERLLYLTPSDE